MELVTGYRGQPHVSAADDGCRNASFIGQGRYVSTVGEKFAATMRLASEITIASGDLFNQGRHMHIREGQYEVLEVADLEAGYYRNDLVVCRYTMDADGIEDCELVVITGDRYNSADSVQDPAYTVGNIFAGATQDDFPLYRLKGTGGSIPVIEQLFEVVQPLSDIQNNIADIKDDITELNGNIKTLIDNRTYWHTKKYSPSSQVAAGSQLTFTVRASEIGVSPTQKFHVKSITPHDAYWHLGVAHTQGTDTFTIYARALVTAPAGDYYYSIGYIN